VRKYRIFFLLLFYSCIHSSHSQDLIYKHYDVQNGLANSTIHSIFQDKDGFLWLGTESGLCRYDGSQFKTFTVKDGLPGNEVFGLFQDSKDRIWLQLYKSNLAYIYKGKIHNQQNDSLLKKIKLATRLFGTAEDKDGNIYLIDLQTVFIISPDNKTIRTINSINGKPIKATGLAPDGNGRILVSTEHALYRVEKNELKHLRTFTLETHRIAPTAILLAPNYIVHGYFGVRSVFIKDISFEIDLPVYSLKHSPLSDSVFSMNTLDGAYLFNINTRKMVKILPGRRITNTFIDRENNLWVGTMGEGIYKISSQAIVNKGTGDSRKNNIYYITKENGRIIVGNNSMELYEYTNNTLVKRDIPGVDAFYTQKIIYYEKLKDNKYLVVHGMGMMSYQKNSVTKAVVAHMLKQSSNPDSTHVLVAAQSGIALMRKDNLETIEKIWDRKSVSALQSTDSIYAGTLSGLFILEKKNGSYHIVDSLLHSSLIGEIRKSTDQSIWVCTAEDGLYCLKNGRVVRHFSDSSGLPSNNTRSLYLQGNTVWAGTDKGLVKITPAGNDFRIQRYSTSDGLPSNIINCIYTDGNMTYVGTPEGLCHFDESMIETTSICNLVLTGVRIGDKVVDFSDKYSLNSQQRLLVEFSGISFRSEQEMTYRYRINSDNENWHTTRLNSLEFNSLPYGDYKLEIIAINKLGKESLPLELNLHINMPFYKTAWFVALMVLLPLSLILFVYYRRVNRAKHRLRQEIKMLELEQMALRSQMNPHFIFNCISAIQQLLAENDTHNTNKFINSFSHLLRQTLDNAPELFIPLNDEIKFLTNYFELERIRLEDRFSYAINTKGIDKTDLLHIPNLVIQPFVENAIKHGIRYKKNGKGFIEVAFLLLDNSLRCTITDNGVGREKTAEMYLKSGVHHKPKGLSITMSRIESLNALTNGNISISIEDLKDENNNPSGTRVAIDFNKIASYDKNSYNR
jgi:ligand-binding sensor domain-containing protein